MSEPILITEAQAKQATDALKTLVLIQAQTQLIRHFASEAQVEATQSFNDVEMQNWLSGKAAAFDIAATALERALATYSERIFA